MSKKRQQLKNSTINTSKNSHHQLRIIGGQWRSRKLSFTAIEGLRPTQDRVRETLFNWLMYDVEGVNCLDVFAGSGALGLEALSRGAKHVQFIEKSQTAATQINRHLMSLDCSRAVSYKHRTLPTKRRVDIWEVAGPVTKQKTERIK